MLDDGDRAEIAKPPQEQEEKTWIDEIASVSVDKLAPREFEQRGRQIAPDVEISDRILREREPPPCRPAKDHRECSPGCELANEFTGCRGLDHF